MARPTDNDWKLFATVKNRDKAAVLYAYLCDGYNMAEVAQNVLQDYNDMASQRVSNITRCYGFSGQNSGIYRRYNLNIKDIEGFVKKYPNGCDDCRIMDEYVKKLYESKQKSQAQNPKISKQTVENKKNQRVQKATKPMIAKVQNESASISPSKVVSDCHEAVQCGNRFYDKEDDEKAAFWYRKALDLDAQVRDGILSKVERMDIQLRLSYIQTHLGQKNAVQSYSMSDSVVNSAEMSDIAEKENTFCESADSLYDRPVTRKVQKRARKILIFGGIVALICKVFLSWNWIISIIIGVVVIAVLQMFSE